jgi:AcrR family transcriptional regulator
MSMPEPVARPRRSQAERSGDTQRRLLVAAAELIHQRGYARLRVADVAEYANVSKGAQLHHFRTKPELVAATLRFVFEEASRLGRYRAEHVSGDVIERLLEDARDFFFSKYFSVALDIVMSSATDDELRNEVFEISRAARLPVEAAWRQALIDAGLPADRAGLILSLTLNIVRGVVIRRLWDDNPAEVEAQFLLWRDMVRATIAAAPAC